MKRLLLAAAMVAFPPVLAACDAGGSAPVAPAVIHCYTDKAGGINCPGYVFPSWIGERCYVYGYDDDQCLQYAAMFGYVTP
jgi:hypothetical protein